MRLRRFAMVALILATSAFCGGSGAQPASDIYRHPDGLFSLIVPQGASVQAGEDGPIAARITSVRGWTVTVQTGKATPGLDLGGMVARLEERYLGPSRAWSAKHGQRASQLGGLPGIELAYEGERARWQVTIARGKFTDFVVFLSGQPDVLTERSDEIRSLLTSFQPRPEEGGSRQEAGIPAAPGKAEAPPPPEQSKKPVETAPVASPSAGIGSRPTSDVVSLAMPNVEALLTQRFDEPSLGFAIDYPSDWMAERESDHTVVFGGRPGSHAYFATVAIQNISPPAATDPIAAANAAFDESKQRIEAAATELTAPREAAFEYDRGGTRLLGREFQVTYRWQGQRFSKWMVVLPNPTYPVAHIFSYTAPENDFPGNRPIADAMLQRWTIRGTEKESKTR